MAEEFKDNLAALEAAVAAGKQFRAVQLTSWSSHVNGLHNDDINIISGRISSPELAQRLCAVLSKLSALQSLNLGGLWSLPCMLADDVDCCAQTTALVMLEWHHLLQHCHR